MSTIEYIWNAEKRDPEKAIRIKMQLEMLHKEKAIVCNCGLRRHFSTAYRCLYCGEYFCFTCAEAHFGKTVKQWIADKDAENK